MSMPSIARHTEISFELHKCRARPIVLMGEL